MCTRAIRGGSQANRSRIPWCPMCAALHGASGFLFVRLRRALFAGNGFFTDGRAVRIARDAICSSSRCRSSTTAEERERYPDGDAAVTSLILIEL
jgi:hypothetical protein